MNRVADVPDWVRVNRSIEAFEAARALARDAAVNLRTFLPGPDDPLRLRVLAELVRVDMEYAWPANRAADYLDRFPELRADPDAVLALLGEESRLRRTGPGSDRPTPETPASPEFPEPGHDFLGFRLLADLGRGAFGRVYRASQGDLAGRNVVLKVTARPVGEPQTLAQLQHTNIVPIHSVHHADGLEAICMPYFGATTLQHVLGSFRGVASLPASGEVFLPSAGTAPVADPGRSSPAERAAPDGLCELLRRCSYVDSVLWIGARLADGLAHAHERGVLHLDLKPANVLLTDDGQPMLLDFNLAQDATARARPDGPRVGGTLPYMAPEHLESVATGECRVDARSDLYSLGVLLFQLLTTQYPFPYSPGQPDLAALIRQRRVAPPRLRTLNPTVSPAAEAIVRRCLAPQPEQRYASARQLAEDLQRQFEHRPLRHAREPSVAERVRKWVRRHPRWATAGPIAVLAACVALVLGVALVQRGRELARLSAARTRDDFRRDLETVRFLLHAPRPPREQLEEGVRLCRVNLDRYAALEGSAPRLPAGEAPALGRDLAEQLYLLVRASEQLHDGRDPPNRDTLDAWLRWNERACAWSGEGTCPATLLRQRARLLRARGDDAAARACLPPEGVEPGGPDGLYLAASESLAAGRLREALPQLERLLAASPQHFWGWVAQGYCTAGLGRDREALASYTTAAALRPDYPWPYHLRGLSRLRLRQDEAAERDFTAALERSPGWWEVLLARSVVRQRGKRHADALADLDAALAGGAPPARVHCMKARVHHEAGDAEAAGRALKEGLRHEPADGLSWVARGVARLPADPKEALADFDRALALDPACQPALQNRAHVLSELLDRPREAVASLDRLLGFYPDALPARGGRAVLLARLGEREVAHRDAEECSLRSSEPSTLFQLAGVYALTSRAAPADAERAVELLRAAVRQGWGYDLLATDRDLDPIRTRADFRSLCAAADAVRNSRQKDSSSSTATPPGGGKPR